MLPTFKQHLNAFEVYWSQTHKENSDSEILQMTKDFCEIAWMESYNTLKDNMGVN